MFAVVPTGSLMAAVIALKFVAAHLASSDAWVHGLLLLCPKMCAIWALFLPLTDPTVLQALRKFHHSIILKWVICTAHLPQIVTSWLTR